MQEDQVSSSAAPPHGWAFHSAVLSRRVAELTGHRRWLAVACLLACAAASAAWWGLGRVAGDIAALRASQTVLKQQVDGSLTRCVVDLQTALGGAECCEAYPPGWEGPDGDEPDTAQWLDGIAKGIDLLSGQAVERAGVFGQDMGGRYSTFLSWQTVDGAYGETFLHAGRPEPKDLRYTRGGWTQAGAGAQVSFQPVAVEVRR